MQKLRATALEGLESVPGHLQNVIDYLEEYDVDERIHRATVAFYVAILAALEEVLVFYTKSAGRSSFQQLLFDQLDRSVENSETRQGPCPR